ncbi:MAG: ROK family protein, partial [Bacteroidota bacterium]
MNKESSNICVGVDIGGSHISACLINMHDNSIMKDSYRECSIDGNQSALRILKRWSTLINETIKFSPDNIRNIGIAIPGPFDYEKGISKILNVGKYEQFFGINIRQYLSSTLNIQTNRIYFINDATAFALGEYHQQYSSKYKRTLALTLGTGFGSTYIIEGVPQSKLLYNEPFKKSIADNYFSTRWFVEVYNNNNSNKIKNVKQLSELAEKGNRSALDIFEEFGNNLGSFLQKHLYPEKVECCIIGGNISKSWRYFAPTLKKHIKTPIVKANTNTHSPLIGAAINTMSQNATTLEKRKTSQVLIPRDIKKTNQGKYDIYPGFKVAKNSIKTGYYELADYIETHKTIVIDGYAGVLWEDLCENLGLELRKRNLKVLWHDVSAALKDSAEIDNMIVPYLGGDDPIFGRKTSLKLNDFFNADYLNNINTDSDADINILYGTGAALCKWDAPLLYVDLPKNELQFRMRAGKITNLGAENVFAAKVMYKRFYFVDWVVLNNHKQQLISDIDIIIDDQRPEKPFWTTGEILHSSLKKMSENYFRVRPWFEPGVWGGSWIKNNIEQLNKDVPNYAWSFELIVPENGLLLEDEGKMLEVSFDMLMFQEYKNVLGNAAEQFGVEFPIRFDFLDTFDGGNLSLQCHPLTEYMKKEFGESFTQDETYYILDKKGQANVYLGFQESIDPAEFRKELNRSFENNTPIDIEDFVMSHPAEKHDLFLIPGGTIHGSGKNNMVLEISATPYIFTFKLYDWLRPDLDGKPRPLNIDRGFDNLQFSRKGKKVISELISKPILLDKGYNWKLIHLPTHSEHFYDVHRYEFQDEIHIETEGQCHIMMLVEGTSLILETENGMRQRFNFAETFVIPAACGKYRLINENNATCKVVKAFV